MECLSNLKVRAAVYILGVFTVSSLVTASAQIQSGQVLVKSVQGRASYSTDQTTWRTLQADTVLGRGAVLRTEAGSTADLILQDSGTVLRLTPNTELGVTKLDAQVAVEQIITDTSLELKSGGIIGSQRKLAKPSRFDITTSGSVATIRGTEYLVKADGNVSCFRGEVEVHYGSGSGSAQVPAGYQFDPGTKQVANYSANYYPGISGDMDRVRQNTQDCKPPPVVCHPKGDDDCHMSPTKPPHDHDHDHDGHGDDGHGNDGHGHGDDHGGNGGNDNHGNNGHW